MSYQNPMDALVDALVLTVTAPTEEQSQRALKLAEQLIADFSLSDSDVSAAQRRAEAILSSSRN